MKVTKIVTYSAERIHTNEKGYPIYQRYPGSLWEIAVEPSWCRVAHYKKYKELEKAYQRKVEKFRKNAKEEQCYPDDPSLRD